METVKLPQFAQGASNRSAFRRTLHTLHIAAESHLGRRASASQLAEGISLHTRILMSASFITWAEDLQPFENTPNSAREYL